VGMVVNRRPQPKSRMALSREDSTVAFPRQAVLSSSAAPTTKPSSPTAAGSPTAAKPSCSTAS
jgi:hypothetical protein